MIAEQVATTQVLSHLREARALAGSASVAPSIRRQCGEIADELNHLLVDIQRGWGADAARVPHLLSRLGQLQRAVRADKETRGGDQLTLPMAA